MTIISRSTVLSPALLALAALATPAAAQETRTGPDTYAVALNAADLRPATPAAARRSVMRIGQAALLVCGASAAAPHGIRMAVRRSPCWRDSMAKVRQRVADPLLLAAWPATPDRRPQP